MNNLSIQMQERLDKWMKRNTPEYSTQKIRQQVTSRRNGKNDYGDVSSVEEWEEEIKKSQKRK